MKLLKQALAILGTVVVMAGVVALVTPKTAHALVATLVQVVNTPTNPVPASLTDALNSFNAENFCQFATSQDDCKITAIYTVPLGKKIAIIETVSGRCVTDTGTGLREVRLDLPAASPFSWLVPGPAFPFYGGEVVSFAQNQKTYISAVSAETPIDVELFATKAQQAGGDNCLVAISGHLH